MAFLKNRKASKNCEYVLMSIDDPKSTSHAYIPPRVANHLWVSYTNPISLITPPTYVLQTQ